MKARTAGPDQTPVFVLTGFLGAGKTTLLNRILADPRFQDTALIINEFGMANVDHDLVRAGRERPVAATSGCICCTAGSDLRASLDEILQARRAPGMRPVSRVIVETTGLADPAPIINSLIPGGVPAFALRDHAVARAFRLSGVIAAVDVQGAEAALRAHPESLRQIAFADHAVLTRTDLAPAGDWPARLRALNPALQVHDAAAAGFEPGALLEPGSYSAFGKGEDVERWLAAEAARDRDPAGHLHDPDRHGAVQAVHLEHDGLLEEETLRRFLTGLTAGPGAGAGILRIKGLAALRDRPEAPAVIHAVQHRIYPFPRLEAWPRGDRRTRLTVIGVGLDPQALRRRFEGLGDRPRSLDAAMAAPPSRRG